jgi:hypothetical protein
VQYLIPISRPLRERHSRITMGLVGDDRFRAPLIEKGAQVIGVVALVGDGMFARADRASRGAAPLMSVTFSPVSRKARGRPSASTRAWIFVVGPLRERPMAWSSGPFLGAAPRTMRLHRRTVDHDEGRRIGLFDQSGEQTLPQTAPAPTIVPVEERRIRPDKSPKSIGYTP